MVSSPAYETIPVDLLFAYTNLSLLSGCRQLDSVEQILSSICICNFEMFVPPPTPGRTAQHTRSQRYTGQPHTPSHNVPGVTELSCGDKLTPDRQGLTELRRVPHSQTHQWPMVLGSMPPGLSRTQADRCSLPFCF